MKTLRISVAEQEGFDGLASLYQQLVGGELKARGTSLSIDVIPWEELWNFAQSKAISRSGLDVSEVGATWLGSLADTNGLRPFPDDFIADLDSANEISQVAWKIIKRVSDTQVLFVPWMIDVRVIYYWKDQLKDAAVNEESAFSSIESMQQTMEKLRSAGKAGWGAPSFNSINTVYNLASWIWAKGNDFVSQDGKRTCLCDPQVLDSMEAYFKLAKFMPGPFTGNGDILRAFREKKITSFMDGPWIWAELFRNKPNGIDFKNIGIALPPGPSFLGGSNLVIWKQAQEDVIEEALQLIRVLTSANVQKKLHEVKGLLPVHNRVINEPPFTTDGNYRTLIAACAKGRYVPPIAMWGHLESSLVRVFGLVWESLKQNHFQMKPDSLTRHLSPLATRFDKMLELF